MENEAKLDLLLKKMEKTERKREEGEKRQAQEMRLFKEAVESWIPAVEKKVDVLQSTVDLLQMQVNQLESSSANKTEQTTPAGTLDSPGVRPNGSTGLDGHRVQNLNREEAEGFTPKSIPANVGMTGGVAPMTCPKFDGDNPIMWKSNCEAYFDVYGIHPGNWVKEEALEGDKPKESKKSDGYQKQSFKGAMPLPLPPTTKGGPPIISNDRIGTELNNHSREYDRLSALKSYRRSKGLCFVCGEKWGRDHKCASSIQLHVVQELLDVLQGSSQSEQAVSEPPESDTLMAISQQAINVTDSNHSIRLRGWVQGIEILMLIDSGSTHSFVYQQIGLKLSGVKAMPVPARVKVADGGFLTCSLHIIECDWLTQGIHFKSNFRLLPLGAYNVILEMDWLERFSPMRVDWVHKWLEFQLNDSMVRLQGTLSSTLSCLPITPGYPYSPNSKPVFIRPYRHTSGQKDEIERQVQEMLQNGVIQHSSSAFSSPALLVKKEGAPGTFQGAMNDTLSPVLRKCALVFFDDIHIYSPDLPTHLTHLRQVLQLLSNHQWKEHISYLGHIISGAGVATDPSKIQSIVDWVRPTTIKKLRGFLGLAGYYRKFIKNFGAISKPLTQLLKKDAPFNWTAEVEQAFQLLKQSLVSAPVLALPDFQQPFTLETDASDLGIGAVLSQNQHPIAYGYDQDPVSVKLLTKLAVNPASHPQYKLHKGLLKHKGRVWVGNNSSMQQQIISALHDSPMGGHLGFLVAYHRIKSLFSWPHMKDTIQQQLNACSICLQSKPDRAKYPGLLQPLPVPDGAWQIISMDFIEGLPRSNKQDCILVVVDKFSKYAHFMTLSHPFSAMDVAKVFMLNVYELHGLPQAIISDRDKIFTSTLWEQLFIRSSTVGDMGPGVSGLEGGGRPPMPRGPPLRGVRPEVGRRPLLPRDWMEEAALQCHVALPRGGSGLR
uniref:OSIGBa0111L12.7 protein n=1 Tax=Oryza sativa TaxID=4530 RepID=Q01IZ5_ORYSA|nr:OSIGBa0111L12.7 [Oryza sativa]